MPIHDVYARLTPYELCLPELEWARERFREVRDEALARGVDAGDPGAFLRLEAVADLLAAVRPAEEAELFPQHAILLYHAFHFWRAGEPLFLLVTPAVKRLAAPVSPPWAGGLPAAAGYVQLPQHLLWTAEEGAPPESIDGFFWAAPGEGGELRLLAVSGMRGDRPGFSVLPLPPLPVETLRSWPELEAREGRPDFRSRLPGAQLEGLLQVNTAGDLLGLAWRALAFLSESGAVEPETAPSVGAPPPTRLPYRRLSSQA